MEPPPTFSSLNDGRCEFDLVWVESELMKNVPRLGRAPIVGISTAKTSQPPRPLGGEGWGQETFDFGVARLTPQMCPF